MATLTITAPATTTREAGAPRLASLSEYLVRAFSTHSFSAYAAATTERAAR